MKTSPREAAADGQAKDKGPKPVRTLSKTKGKSFSQSKRLDQLQASRSSKSFTHQSTHSIDDAKSIYMSSCPSMSNQHRAMSSLRSSRTLAQSTRKAKAPSPPTTKKRHQLAKTYVKRRVRDSNYRVLGVNGPEPAPENRNIRILEVKDYMDRLSNRGPVSFDRWTAKASSPARTQYHKLLLHCLFQAMHVPGSGWDPRAANKLTRDSEKSKSGYGTQVRIEKCYRPEEVAELDEVISRMQQQVDKEYEVIRSVRGVRREGAGPRLEVDLESVATDDLVSSDDEEQIEEFLKDVGFNKRDALSETFGVV